MEKQCICQTTAYNWMKKLGYKYETSKKTYYTDTHEKAENVAYRIEFVKRYLFEYEQYMLRWIQIPINELQTIYPCSNIPKLKKQNYLNTVFKVLNGYVKELKMIF